jgi:hypothetical protein
MSGGGLLGLEMLPPKSGLILLSEAELPYLGGDRGGFALTPGRPPDRGGQPVIPILR